MNWLEIAILAIIISLALGLATINTTSYKKIKKDVEKWDSMIKECEKSLPRNQHCTLIAVPETQVKEKQ